MEEDLRMEADRRFTTRLEETGARDPRDLYRELLRRLKARDEEAYEAAVLRFRDEVVAAISQEDRDPVEAWMDYGLSLARGLHPGRTVVLDATGRSESYAPPPDGRSLILHLPKEKRARAILVNLPAQPTPAQQAALDLLVEGKVRPAEG